MSGEVAPDRGSRRGPLFLWFAVGLAGLAAWSALYLWQPSSDPDDTVCVLRRTAGASCPGCGFGRASSSLAKGRFAAAAIEHPLVFLVALQGIVVWGYWGTVIFAGIRRPRDVWFPRLMVANAAGFVVVWVVRIVTATLPP